ncbi:hypothetical protein BDA96_08G029300 [Sorghum bicolor]|uniref:Uncharacterized protein n=2 Tax=Sorghum bicolor TaxID=4558 RepID=A0A921QDV2_SORBI|nr:hypothetical protein BDA96_08G029300 [Sorghum bicolor]KXG22913.1 hypothetical protein SORBI_3008G026500 [Sorghum bicolor]
MPMSCESVHSDSKDSATAPKLRRHGTRHHSQLQLPPKSLMNSDRGTTAAPCLLFSSQTRNNTPCWFCHLHKQQEFWGHLASVSFLFQAPAVQLGNSTNTNPFCLPSLAGLTLLLLAGCNKVLVTHVCVQV